MIFIDNNGTTNLVTIWWGNETNNYRPGNNLPRIFVGEAGLGSQHF